MNCVNGCGQRVGLYHFVRAEHDAIFKTCVDKTLQGEANFGCVFGVDPVLQPDLPLIKNQRAGMDAVNDFE